MQTNTLIIGGGPAGSLCGIALKKSGKDCVIVDRARFPRLKLCAGVLTGKSRDVLSEVLGRGDAGKLIEGTVMAREKRLRIWRGRHCFVDCDMTSHRHMPERLQGRDWRFVLVDRPRFDAALVSRYKALGGTIVEGDGVKRIDFDEHVARLASGETIEYRHLVAADGAASHTEHLLRKAAPDFKGKGENAEAFEINVDSAELKVDGLNVCFGYAPQTYAWAFAKGSKTCIGTCKLPGAHFSGREVMERFCGDLGLKSLSRYPLQAAIIPFDNAMAEPQWHGHVYFVGDAAGLDEAVTGEGIFYALRSGADAAEAIAKANPPLYIKRNARLQALMRKAARYQRLLASPWLWPLFRVVATLSNRFVGYFYLTQVDHSSLDRATTILAHYIKEVWARRR